MLQAGIKGSIELTVTKEKCAGALGSGELDVFATPAMIALMEETAWKSVAPYLEPGEGTVGTALDVRHLAATPVGLRVRCDTELTLVQEHVGLKIHLVVLNKFYEEAAAEADNKENAHKRAPVQFVQLFPVKPHKHQAQQQIGAGLVQLGGMAGYGFPVPLKDKAPGEVGGSPVNL